MLSYRHRKYCCFVLDTKSHEAMIEWKKASRHETKPLPGDLLLSLYAAIGEHFQGFDMLSVPAPSFHDYKNYPIWEVAKEISTACNIQLAKLFPHNSGKVKMGAFGSLSKQVQDIDCPSGRFILLIDDLYTTGATLKVSCEAICRKGSFPVGLAIA